MATIEEASNCPRCGLTGDAGPPQPGAKRRTKVIVYTCKNERCKWYETGWPVQVNPDGSVPDPEETQRGPKQFDRPNDLEVARTMEDVNRYAEYFDNKSSDPDWGRR